MNVQTIQILFLLLDNFIKLAPWRIVTETMDRIGYGASESVGRSLRVIAISCAGLCAFPPTSVIGSWLLVCHSDGAMGVAYGDRESATRPDPFRISFRRDGVGRTLVAREKTARVNVAGKLICFADDQGKGTFRV